MISQPAPGTTTARKSPPAHDPASWSMLDRLARGVVSPLGSLRDAIDLTLEQVADWIADAKNRRRINNLLMLLNVQAQLLLSEHRLIAAERLLDVINDPKAAPETVRRACSDLLRTNLVDLVELRRGQKWEGESEEPQPDTAHRAVAHTSGQPSCATAAPGMAEKESGDATAAKGVDRAATISGSAKSPEFRTGLRPVTASRGTDAPATGVPAVRASGDVGNAIDAKPSAVRTGLHPVAPFNGARSHESDKARRAVTHQSASPISLETGPMFIAHHDEGGSLNRDAFAA